MSKAKQTLIELNKMALSMYSVTKSALEAMEPKAKKTATTKATKPTARTRWKATEDRRLRSMWKKDLTPAEIAKEFGRTEAAVSKRASVLGFANRNTRKSA